MLAVACIVAGAAEAGAISPAEIANTAVKPTIKRLDFVNTVALPFNGVRPNLRRAEQPIRSID